MVKTPLSSAPQCPIYCAKVGNDWTNDWIYGGHISIET